MDKAKALFWRRVAFVYRYAGEDVIQEMEKEFDGFGWGEGSDLAHLDKLNNRLMQYWEPLYSKFEEGLR